MLKFFNKKSISIIIIYMAYLLHLRINKNKKRHTHTLYTEKPNKINKFSKYVYGRGPRDLMLMPR